LTNHEDNAVVETLERRLLNPRIRSSGTELDELVADDFVEFGRSGRVWTKSTIIESLLQAPSVEIEIDSVQCRHICDSVVLLTYRSRRVGEDHSADTLRSSIWQRRDDVWQIIFHQGTQAEP
jgi:hypothetical protein